VAAEAIEEYTEVGNPDKQEPDQLNV